MDSDDNLSPARKEAAKAVSNLQCWQSLPRAARQQVLESIAARLGKDFTVAGTEIGRAKLGALAHAPSRMEFVVVPGGTMWMGMGVDDLYQIARMVPKSERGELEGQIRERPAHAVAVRPFLLSRDYADLAQLCGRTRGENEVIRIENQAIAAAVTQAGFRLPSEAEWEWIAREGGGRAFTSTAYTTPMPKGVASLEIDFEENGFGLKDMMADRRVHGDGAATLLADDWHPNYDGAPTTSAAWITGAGLGVARAPHTSFQCDFEVYDLHAACRQTSRSESELVRLALDIPDTAFALIDPEVEAKSTRHLLQALSKGREKDLQAAYWTVERYCQEGILSEGEGASLLDGVIPLLAVKDDKELARLLEIAAHAVVGSHFQWCQRKLAGAEAPPLRPQAVARLSPHRERLVGFLGRENAVVSTRAALLLAVLGERDVLAQAVADETNRFSKASMLLGLGCLGDEATPCRHLADEDDLVAACAGLGLAIAVGRGKLSPEAVFALVRGLTLAPLKADDWPWLGGELVDAILALLKMADEAAKAAAAMALLQTATNTHDRFKREALVLQAMPLLFCEAKEIRQVDSLTPAQKDFLVGISAPRLSLEPQLSAWGIPNELDIRRSWLGLAPKTAIDRVVEMDWMGTKRQWTVWEWYYAYLAEKQGKEDNPELALAAKAVCDGLDPLFQLELILEQKHSFSRDSALGLYPKDVWPAARASDPVRAKSILEAARADVVRAADPHYEVIELYIVALGAGETLDPRIAAKVDYGDSGYARKLLHVEERAREGVMLKTLLKGRRHHPRPEQGHDVAHIAEAMATMLGKTSSEKLVRELVAFAGYYKQRQKLWSFLRQVENQVPAVGAVFAGMGKWAELSEEASEADVAAFLKQYPL